MTTPIPTSMAKQRNCVFYIILYTEYAVHSLTSRVNNKINYSLLHAMTSVMRMASYTYYRHHSRYDEQSFCRNNNSPIAACSILVAASHHGRHTFT